MSEIINENLELTFSTGDRETIAIKKEIKSVMVINSVGQIQKSLTTDDHKVDVRSLKPGIYFVKVLDKSGNIYNSKFVKK
jgi:hypothetical protein